PGGGRLTLTYRDWLTTKVTDALGRVTTLVHDYSRHIAAVVDPLGQRTSTTWSGNRPVLFRDGRGNRTTLIWATPANRTLQLQGVIQPTGGRSTYLFDANSRLSSLQLPLVGRTTLLWDASGNRKAVVDPLGQRVTFPVS